MTTTPVTSPSDADLLAAPLGDLLALASAARDAVAGTRVTYSPKVFIPLTMLCRDRCAYCTFAKPPARLGAPFLELEEVVAIAEAGRIAGCHEALFTLGERPELRYPGAQAWLEAHGFESTVAYLEEACRATIEHTGLLPHSNAGALSEDDARLRPVTVSQGMMLESLNPTLDCHRSSPDKTPARRLATLEAAGRLQVPFTTGILIGIGESRQDRLTALRAIADLHERHGHVQEVIVQNFLPKHGTAMHREAPCPEEEHLWSIAVARLILQPEIHLQAPPNLTDDFGVLLEAGIDDWGGVSPVTLDHVNPERAWPALDRLAEVTESRGHVLAPRLAIHPEWAARPERFLDVAMAFPVLDHSDAERLARDSRWVSGGDEPPPMLRRPTSVAVPPPLRTMPVPAQVLVFHRGPVADVLGAVAAGEVLGEDEIVALFSARGSEVRAVAESCRRAAAGGRRGRRHLRGEPQHQLHERVHVQVPFLRLFEGPALTQPPGRPLSPRSRRDHA